MAIKEGWTGRVFEDFTVGDVYPHPLGRTVLDADNVWFSCLTMNTNPIHFDGEYAARTEFKKRLVNSCFTLSLVTGQSVTDLTMNGVANLGWDEVRLPHPVFDGFAAGYDFTLDPRDLDRPAAPRDGGDQGGLERVPVALRNVPPALRVQQFVRSRIVWQSTPGLTLPVTAVSRISGQYFCFVAEQGPGGLVARQRPVQVGELVGNDYTVTGGLKAGDKVVVSGIQKIGDGAPIKPE